MEFGAAESCEDGLYDDVGWVLDLGDGSVLEGDFVRAVEDDGSHCGLTHRDVSGTM